MIAWLLACTPTPVQDAPTPLPMMLTSATLDEGGTFPLANECGPPIVADGPGDNLSPALTWTPGPEGTASYTVVMQDLDASAPGFPDGILHWAIYNLPASTTSLPEGIPEGEEVDAAPGARQGELQGSGLFGYFGPCSPNSVNTYRITVYALGEERLPLAGDRSESNVAATAAELAIESASLSGES